MEKIDKETFDSVKTVKKRKEEGKYSIPDSKSFEDMIKAMNDPLEAQKELAVQIKMFLDRQIDKELSSDSGRLSEFTRRWVKEYNSTLEKLQRGIYGDKSVTIGVHKITHSHIAEKIRKYV